MSWYWSNREKALEYQNAYAKQHRDRYLAYQKVYYQQVLKPKREKLAEEAYEKARQEYEKKALLETPIQSEKPVKETIIKQKRARAPPGERKPREKVVWMPTIKISTGEFILRFD